MGTEGPMKTSMNPEEIADYSYILVDRGRKRDNISRDDWRILVVKSNGEVFGSVGYEGTKTEGKRAVEYERVDSLCGLNVRKVAAGLGFGVALTADGILYKWAAEKFPKEAIYMVEAFRDGPCHCGNTLGGQRQDMGRFNVLYCPHSSPTYRVYTHRKPPPLGVKVWRFLRHDAAHQVLCSKCAQICQSGSFIAAENLSYCKQCCRYAEAGDFENDWPSGDNLSKLETGIIDVDAGETFICYLADDLQLKLKLNDTNTITVAQPPDYDTVQSVSCGSKHIAVITKAGDLYSYGDLEGEDISTTSAHKTISLMKLILPGRAREVCCWDRSTLCLQEDKSIFLFQNGSPLRLISASWFCDGSIKPILAELYDKSMTQKLLSIFQGIQGQDSHAFWNHLISKERLRCSAPSKKDETATQQSMNLSENQKKLYGNKRQSDITLKLADEDFPAHSVILISTSQYFQKIYETDTVLSTLDMTSYNPRAYKCLLQHLYQVPPEELPVNDLLDLLELATSYGENQIVKAVVKSLETYIQAENVLKVLSKARSLANQELIDSCGNFIRSTAFKDYFAELCIKDPSQFL